MFSVAQQQYIDDIALQMYMQGYTYYIAHTNTNMSNDYNNQHQDLILYFSKSEIKCVSQYDFQFSEKALKYTVRTSSANRNYNDERVVITTQSATIITINDYEFISTNATNSQSMNVIAEIEYNDVHNLNYNMSLNDYYVLPLCVIIFFMTCVFKWTFPNSKGN